jgi:hypothetical protein
VTTYTREQTANWTQADWDRLAGQAITLRTPNGVWASERTVKSALLAAGPYSDSDVVVVEWVPEGSLTFSREGGADITVHN